MTGCTPSDLDTLVFDTGPLSHFARAGWLGVLKAVVGDRRAMIPDVVVRELEIGARTDARIQAALDATWILRQELSSPEELAAFASFASKLAVGERNLGECGVLALGATIQRATVVLDDGVARRAAQHARISLRSTLALLCDS